MEGKSKNSTRFSSENQPAKKGCQWFKTKVIESLKRQNMTEDQFIDSLVIKALSDGGVYLTELLKRYSPIAKQTFEPIVIDNWPKTGTSAEKANVILDHLAEGNIPADLASMMIESISKSLGIEELTELAKRLEALERIINAQKA